MDADRFDDLLRSLSAPPSRRGITRALAGLAVTGALGPLFGLVDADAKRKRKKKKKKKKAPASPPGGCTPNCDRKICGDNGCGGSCGSCATCQTCTGGVCVDAQDGASCANGSCLAGVCEECGRNGLDCCAGGICFQGECANDGKCGACGSEGELCCTDDSCDGDLICTPTGDEFRCFLF